MTFLKKPSNIMCCIHCGLPVNLGLGLTKEGDQFYCSGCHMLSEIVWRLV